MVIAFQYIMEVEQLAVVPGDRETHGVGSRVIRRKVGAIVTRIAQLAQSADRSFLGWPQFGSPGVADAGPESAERKQGRSSVGVAGVQLHRVKVGA